MTAHCAHPNPYDSPAARRAFLDLDDRLKALDEEDRDLYRIAHMPGRDRWIQQIQATGGCAHPIYLAGQSTTYDTATGLVLRHYTTAEEPGGRLAVRCRNRRESRCAPCSREYQGDTFHLIRAGLLGGKNVPESVKARPRLFVTLTAPGFGTVHQAGDCHPDRGGRCPHGQRRACHRTHHDGDALIGQPLCARCYDYTGHVLWNAHAPALWKAFTDNLYHHFAAATGTGRTKIRRQVRISAAKVAEYQARGAVHFHAVLRLDGPDGPATEPPPWASAELLARCVPTAAAAVALALPPSDAVGDLVLRFGEQLDVHPIDATGLRDDQVAGYVAKYTTKSVEAAGALDRRITDGDQIPRLRTTEHVRALIGTAWRLGEAPEFAHLRLRAWAHMLGFRGHCLTKTRAYSTTLGQLRAARAEHARSANSPDLYLMTDDGTDTVSTWHYVGSGHTPGEALIAAGIAEDLALMREVIREVLADERAGVSS
ncbi:replication initiator [Phaeacidiphilus oryzae]|uniref:replication initiator n=1 Tax=Phaeacidiphilus oryzae TaxID=348818 RepID=UPI000B295A80|nr:replication initiator [Phaeacidiphilus oryzae]